MSFSFGIEFSNQVTFLGENSRLEDGRNTNGSLDGSLVDANRFSLIRIPSLAALFQRKLLLR